MYKHYSRANTAAGVGMHTHLTLAAVAAAAAAPAAAEVVAAAAAVTAANSNTMFLSVLLVRNFYLPVTHSKTRRYSKPLILRYWMLAVFSISVIQGSAQTTGSQCITLTEDIGSVQAVLYSDCTV